MAGEPIIVYSATTTSVVSSAAAIASGSSAGGTNILDNSTEKYPWARAVLDIPDTFAGAPTNNSTVDLYMVMQDVDNTSDDTAAPASGDMESAQLVGSFLIYDTDEAQRKTITISLHGVLKAHFYIYNGCGQQLSYTSNPITVKVTPFSYIPAA
jgi:hypothetical protein